MPTKVEIQKEIADLKGSAQDIVRHRHLTAAAEISGRDTILYASAWTSPKRLQKLPAQLLSLSPDDVQGFMASIHGLTGTELDLVLHSPGGSSETADQIVQYLRSKYRHIRAIVPHNAMSAATMLACSCDEIVMGRQSAIGPIDPQISWATAAGGISAPAQSILDEFVTAQKDVTENPRTAAIWATRLKDYPPGVFESCKTTMALAKQKVSDWLSRYMFNGEVDGAQKAEAIATWLSSASEHKSHSRPLGFEICLEKGLKVSRLEDNQDFQDAILSVFHAAAVAFETTNCIKIVESHMGRGNYMHVQANGS